MPVSPSLYIWEVVISVHGMAHAGSHTHTQKRCQGEPRMAAHKVSTKHQAPALYTQTRLNLTTAQVLDFPHLPF